MVQSARVQEIVKGDDVVMTHQIMKSVAYNAELSRAPDPLQEGDTVNFFYPLEDTTMTDLIGYPGVPVGSYPADTFTVPIQGNIPAVGTTPARGTSTFQSGLGRTVRAEITRLKATVTGNTDGSTGVITNISSMSGIVLGMSVVGVGIPPLSIIIAIGASSITINNNTTAEGTGVSLALGQKETQYSIDEVDVYERGFPNSLCDTSGGVNPPESPLNLT